MNLVAVREYFKNVPMANCIDAASFFGTTPNDILCYIEHWEHRGCLMKCTKKSHCLTRCKLCNPLLVQYYKWQRL